MPRLIKRAIDAELKKGGRDRFLWDSELKGFGARLGASRCAFILQYRTAQQRSRRLSLGVYGPMTVDQARRKALSFLAAVQQGADPATAVQEARHALTVSELCAKYQD